MAGINSCLLKYGEKEKLELLLIEISFLKFKIFSLPISAKSVYKIKCNLILEVKSKLTNSQTDMQVLTKVGFVKEKISIVDS